MANVIASVLVGTAVLSYKKIRPAGEPDVDAALVEVGYTEDGVTIEYSVDAVEVEVEEETFPIKRVITKETVAITCNFAESSLLNITRGMIGAKLDDEGTPTILTLGGGDIADEEFTSNHDVPVQLNHSMIATDSENVEPDGGGASYVKGTDYTIDYRDGNITVLGTGTMADATTFDIDYTYGSSSNVVQLQIDGTAPPSGVDSYTRCIAVPEATAVGVVGMAYKKGEKTIVPVTFQAIRKAATDVCTITDTVV